MRKSFDALWEVMEARRRQVKAGEVPPACRSEHTRQARRRAMGCPDEEALCGRVDGQLRRNSLRRWLTVWRHMQLRHCRECQAQVAALVAAMRSDQRRLAWRWSAMKGFIAPWLPRKTPLAWASSVLVIAVGLSLWSLGTRGSFSTFGNQSGPPLIEDRRILPPVDSGDILDAQTEPSIIWGD